MFCPKCGVKVNEKTKSCSSCGKPLAEIEPKTSKKEIKPEKKLPPKTKKIAFLLLGAVGIALVVVFLVFSAKKLIFKQKPLTTFDDYPIWLMRDGKVIVYRQMKVFSDSVEKQIVVSSKAEPGEKITVYETIPKEVAQKTSEVTFNIPPEIVEDDPVVKFELDPTKNTTITWQAKTNLPKIGKGRYLTNTPFLNRFEDFWPTMIQKDNAVVGWDKAYRYSEKEQKKSSQLAAAGKGISVSKDLLDITSSIVTGPGILDAAGIMSEIYNIGITIYDQETPAAVENANFWLMILSLAKSGAENKELIKSSMRTAAIALKVKEGAKAADTVIKMGETADAVADAQKGISAAQSAGLNIAGILVDYAVINDVASTAKYNVFEADAQAKMAFLAKNLKEGWRKYPREITEADAKKIMEMEIFFFIAQQDELKVRKEYFKSQTGSLDSLVSFLPVVGKNTAKSNIAEIENLERQAAQQLNARMGAYSRIYTETPGGQTGLEAIRKAEKQALTKTEELQEKKEKITKVEPGVEGYDIFKKASQKTLTSVQPISRLVPKQEVKITPVATSPPAETGSQSSGKGFNFSVDIFPATLLGYARGKTSTSPPSNECFRSLGATGYIYAEYGPENNQILASISQLPDSEKAGKAASQGADCMTRTAASKDVTFQITEREPLSGYPFSVMKDNTGILIGSFLTVDRYLLNISMLVPDARGGKETDHREAMKVIFEAFTGNEPMTQILPTTPPTKAAGSCQTIDLSANYKTYWFYDSQFPCNSYSRSASSSRFSVRCNDPVSRWREHYIKEIPTNGAASLKIKANLTLDEHLRFFIESNGIGVKYDDYVDLIVLGSDPNSQLASECNRAYTSSTIAQCGARDKFSVIGHCGVPKFTASKTCDFNINTSGLSKIYLMFYTSDAWPADVEGILANAQVCYE